MVLGSCLFTWGKAQYLPHNVSAGQFLVYQDLNCRRTYKRIAPLPWRSECFLKQGTNRLTRKEKIDTFDIKIKNFFFPLK